MVETAGTLDEFERFYAAEYRRLVPMLHALTGSRSAAEDVAQEALHRAHQRWDVVSSYEQPGGWVRRVAFNLASNVARSARRERDALQRVEVRGAVEFDPVDDRLWALVRSLPDQQRWAVVLHYIEDRSVAEVATILEISEGTVKTHLSRARTTLARGIKEGDDQHA